LVDLFGQPVVQQIKLIVGLIEGHTLPELKASAASRHMSKATSLMR
jgi:hypothetical protein